LGPVGGQQAVQDGPGPWRRGGRRQPLGIFAPPRPPARPLVSGLLLRGGAGGQGGRPSREQGEGGGQRGRCAAETGGEAGARGERGGGFPPGGECRAGAEFVIVGDDRGRGARPPARRVPLLKIL